MSDELAEIVKSSGGSVIAELPDTDLEIFNDMRGGDILPFITLQGSNSDLVKDDKIEKGHFTLTYRKGEFLDIGTQFEAVVVAGRRKALDIQDKNNPIWSFDVNSPIFQKIQEQAHSKDDNVKRSRLYGLEFLLYIPDVEEQYRYCTLFMGNASGRQEAPRFRPFLKKTALLKSAKARNDKYIWEVIKIHATQRHIELPSFDEAAAVLEGFKNPREMPLEKQPQNVEAPTQAVNRG